MKRDELVGKAQTVLGTVDPTTLGTTLTHEHILHDLSTFFREPAAASDRRFAHEPVQMENLYWVRLHEANNLDNLKFTDEQLATKEVTAFKLAMGDTIVELTTRGPNGRDPLGLARISRATGVNIIMGSGHYIAPLHPPEVESQTEDEIAREIVEDITVGVDHTGIRAGIIGEIGCSLHPTQNELKVLRASVAAQQQTGAALCVHPSPDADEALEICEILKSCGADLTRTIICHVDLFDLSLTTSRRLLDYGCYIANDNFGVEGLFHLPAGGGSVELADTKRINCIVELIADGHLNQLLISHDIATKHRLTAYGGFGFGHITRDVLPIMRMKGISDAQIHTLLVDNPKRILAFV